MKFRHEDLEVWKQSKAFVSEIYTLTTKLPRNEDFNLTSQIRRSVLSVTLNITEGCARFSKDDFAKFLRISIGSLLETDCSLQVASELGYITKTEYNKARLEVESIYFKLIALERSLKDRKKDFNQRVQQFQQLQHHEETS